MGRGTTSIVYEDPADPEYVFMLTKDSIKNDWLSQQWGLKIGERINILEPSKSHPIKNLRDMDIYVTRVPKLYKISPVEFRKITNILMEYPIAGRPNRELKLAKLERALRDPRTDAVTLQILRGLHTLYYFLSEYTDDMYAMDLHSKNIMKDKNGNYVIVDPVIDQNILDAIRSDVFQKQIAKHGKTGVESW